MSLYRLYAIVRGDLHMPPGKLAAQAGHAFMGAFREANAAWGNTRAVQYDIDPPGTKIVLVAKHQTDLEWAYARAQRDGIPCSLITDSGHVLPPHFDGSPVMTAVGIGPVQKDELPWLAEYSLV